MTGKRTFSNLFFTAISLLILARATPLSAHVLIPDGPITVFIHVSPDDDPIIGEKAQLHIWVMDKEDKFDLEKCNCTLLIGNDKLPVADEVNYTFPHAGIYTISVSGTPIGTASFPPFNISYDLRVSREPKDKSWSWLYIMIPGIIIGGIIVWKVKN